MACLDSITGNEYTIRESSRAEKLHLKISFQRGLEVVIPKGFDPGRIPEFLREHSSWIQKGLRRIEEQRRLLGAEEFSTLPERIPLRSIGEEWRVLYEATSSSCIRISEAGKKELSVRGRVEDINTCRESLKRWIIRKAHDHLVPWLEKTSREHGISFTKAMIRGQRTRWGSCSSRKTIIINYKLIFLPSDLVRYLFIHELCHTIHLDHSRAFWNLVKEKDPGYKKWDDELRSAGKFIPMWIEYVPPLLPSCP